MKLAKEIIAILSDEKSSLNGALLKTKVLLYEIGHAELTPWVNFELNGYPPTEPVPDYRKLPAQVLAHISNSAWQVTSHPIPTFHLEEEYRQSLEIAEMHQPLAVLEKFSSQAKGHLESPIPLEANHLFNKALANGYKVQRAWCEISLSETTKTVTQVRSRLLEFMLAINKEFDNLEFDSDLADHSSSFDAKNLFNEAIFGDNTTIIVGNGNNQKTINKVEVRDFSTLANHLRRHGVSNEDISFLEEAIEKDDAKADINQRTFGPSVKTWLSGMLSKAVESSWQIELGVASSLLASSLQKYYGWL